MSLHPECELTSKALFSFWKSKALQLVFNRMRTYGVMTSSKGEGKQHATSPRKSQMAQSLRYKVRVSTKMRIKNIIGRQIQFYVALDERVLRSDVIRCGSAKRDMQLAQHACVLVACASWPAGQCRQKLRTVDYRYVLWRLYGHHSGKTRVGNSVSGMEMI